MGGVACPRKKTGRSASAALSRCCQCWMERSQRSGVKLGLAVHQILRPVQALPDMGRPELIPRPIEHSFRAA